MAGIEKICEYSGEHGGYEMYDFKRNHIQVLPEYRKHFKDHRALLVFFEEPTLVNYCEYGPQPFMSFFGKCIPKFWTRFYWQWRDVGMYYRKPSLVWDYVLYVPECLGRVKGFYWNDTRDPEKTLSNLTKLVDYLEVASLPFANTEDNRKMIDEMCLNFKVTVQ